MRREGEERRGEEHRRSSLCWDPGGSYLKAASPKPDSRGGARVMQLLPMAQPVCVCVDVCVLMYSHVCMSTVCVCAVYI